MGSKMQARNLEWIIACQSHHPWSHRFWYQSKALVLLYIHVFLLLFNSNLDPIFNCTVLEIRRLKCRKSTIFHTPLLFWLKFGGDPFGVDPWCWGQPRLESQVHKIRHPWNYFGRIPMRVITIYQRYTRTDRRTDNLSWQYRATLRFAR